MMSSCVTSLFTCDICGNTEEELSQIKPGDVFDREFPTGWTVGSNPNVCICPECDQKLHAESIACSTYTDEPKETEEDESAEDTPWIVRQAAWLKRYCTLQDNCVTCLLNKTGTEDTECLLRHMPIDHVTCAVSKDWIKAESRLNSHAQSSEGQIVRNLIDNCDDTKCKDCCFHRESLHKEFCEFHCSAPEDWDLDIEK